MPRRLSASLAIVGALGALGAPAAADELSDQAVGAEIGVAGGAGQTPGGLRVAGRYLYQLSDQDWFDGVASFTYGSGGAECFRDRMNELACDHGPTDGSAVEIAATVRRMFPARGAFRPFARAGLGVALVRFNDDDLTGLAFPLHLGGGLHVRMSSRLAIVAQAELTVGIAAVGDELGVEPQLGLAVTAGVEFGL